MYDFEKTKTVFEIEGDGGLWELGRIGNGNIDPRTTSGTK